MIPQEWSARSLIVAIQLEFSDPGAQGERLQGPTAVALVSN